MRLFFMWFVGILVLGLGVVVIGCNGSNDQKLNIRIEDKIIRSVELDDSDEIDIFKNGFSRDDLLGSEFVEFGEKIRFDFSGNMPDKIKIWDSILTLEGDYMYGEIATVIVTCERDDDGYYFILKKHPASGLSSIREDGRVDLRGYRVRVSSSGEDDVVYGFVIKTIGS